MERSTQVELALEFKELHRGPRFLPLPSAWDAASARLHEVEGFEWLAVPVSVDTEAGCWRPRPRPTGSPPSGRRPTAPGSRS